MPRHVQISSASDPRIADYANLRDRELRLPAADERTGHGLFIAEGELVVRILLASRFPTRSVLLSPTRLETMQDALQGLPEQTPVYIAPHEILESIVGFNLHRGVLAIGERLPNPALGEVLKRCRGLCILEDLTNHDNIGAMFRNTAALGGPRFGVLLSPRCADPLYRKAIRVSMGHALRVPFAVAEPWPGSMREVKELGYVLVALTPGEGAVDIAEAAAMLAGRGARPGILIGTEYRGLSEDALRAADVRVRIPIHSGVDSLNAAVAGAIALHRLAGVREPEGGSGV